MLKQNKGITLVALVITIIVLLILAGVSISMVVGENGVLNRASDATTKTAKAQAKEALEMAISGMQGEYADDIAKGTSDSFVDFLKTKTAANITGQMNGYTVTKWKADKNNTADADNCKYITVVIGTGDGTDTNNLWEYYIEESSSIGAKVSETKPAS